MPSDYPRGRRVRGARDRARTADQEAGFPLSPEELAHIARLPRLAEQLHQAALRSAEAGATVPRAWVDHVREAIERLEAADAAALSRGAPES
jgi:hypothetical protein